MRKNQFDPTTELNQTTPKEGNNQNKKKVVVKMVTGFGPKICTERAEILCNELSSKGYTIINVAPMGHGLVVSAVLND